MRNQLKIPMIRINALLLEPRSLGIARHWLLRRFSDLLTGSFLSSRVGGRFRFRGERHLHPFKNRTLAGVALALAKPHDSRVAATPLFVSRGDFVEENLDRIFLVQPRNRQAARLKRATLAECHHLLGHRTGGLRFRDSGRNAFVFDQAADHVGQHGVSVLAGAAEFSGSLKMSHRWLDVNGSRPSWCLPWGLPATPLPGSCRASGR